MRHEPPAWGSGLTQRRLLDGASADGTQSTKRNDEARQAVSLQLWALQVGPTRAYDNTMASCRGILEEAEVPAFTGTNQEFKRYIGPWLRNLVQMITKKHKATVAACEHCGVVEDLESAHIQGRDRNQIIDRLIAAGSSAHVLTVDLERFENDFRREHDPVEKSILILCRQCHVKYDSGGRRRSSRSATGISAADILPVTLEPPQPAEFKRKLLTSRRAEIVTYYRDGRVEHCPWEASRFSENSNVMGNIRSRPEFRQGTWQAAGIAKVHVCVTERDGPPHPH